MLYTVNRGNTGYPKGCQSQIVHLVTSVEAAIGLGQKWAFSDGNAGAAHANFFAEIESLSELDWDAIKSADWAGSTRMHRKMAEFLVESRFPWTAIQEIGCLNQVTAREVRGMISRYGKGHEPSIQLKRAGYTDDCWYYP